MSTGRDIVQGALKLLGVLGAGEVAASPDAEEALDELNKMALAWDAKNIHTGWTTIALDDPFPLEERHRPGVEAMLAEHLQGSYGNPMTQMAMRRAQEGYALLFADYHRPEALTSDPGLLGYTPGGWSWSTGWQ